MALDNFLLSILQDPVDRQPLLYVEDRNVLYNPRARLLYEVRGSIPVLLPDEARHVEDDEHESLVNDPSATLTGERG